MQREDGLYLCQVVALLRCALSLAGRVAQSEDDGSLIERRHVFDDLLRKRSSDSSHAFNINNSHFKINQQEAEDYG